ncbi:MAG: hypothetical protein WA963_03295 [Bermanella sp.]
MKRTQLINLHLILAALLLPAIAMFSITGGLYTWGVKGSYDTETFKLPIAQPLKGDLASMVAFAQQEMDKQQQAYPTGAAKLKSNGHTHILEWTGSDLDINLSTDKNSRQAQLAIKHTSAHRYLVQLHKAKGGSLFKLYAAIMAFGVLIIMLSGVLMGLGMPKYRNTTWLALGAGIAIWLGAVSLS